MRSMQSWCQRTPSFELDGLLLVLEGALVEELLQLLVAVVDEEQLTAVDLEAFLRPFWPTCTLCGLPGSYGSLHVQPIKLPSFSRLRTSTTWRYALGCMHTRQRSPWLRTPGIRWQSVPC